MSKKTPKFRKNPAVKYWENLYQTVGDHLYLQGSQQDKAIRKQSDETDTQLSLF